MQNQLFTRRQVLTAIAVVVGVVGLVLFIIDYRKARLTINAPEGAEILATTERDEPVEQIGVGSATIKTSSTDRIYVLVQKDGQVTQAVYVLESGERREVTIDLTPVLEKDVLAEGALSHIYLERDYAFGTDPLAQELIWLPRTNKNNPGVDYSLVSKLDDVTWVDRNNFVYDSFGGGATYFKDGQVVFLNDEEETEGEFVVSFQDYASQDPSKRILFLRDDKLYVASGMNDKTISKLADVPTTRDSSMYAVGDEAVLVTPRYNDIISNPEEEGQAEFGAAAYDFFVVDYQGREVTSFTIEVENTIIEDIVAYKDGYAVLTNMDAYVVDGDGNLSDSLPLFFEQAQDIAAIGDELIILNKAGLWRYDTNTELIRLLAEYGEDEKYAPKSLEVKNNQITYSVTIIEEKVENIDPETIDFTGESERGDVKPIGYVYRLDASSLR